MSEQNKNIVQMVTSARGEWARVSKIRTTCGVIPARGRNKVQAGNPK
jgi:hypothetical protein